MARPIIPLTGKTFGRLTVTSTAPRRQDQPTKVRWYAQCTCGKTIDVAGWQITSGHTRSCGCLKRESRRNYKTKGSLS